MSKKTDKMEEQIEELEARVNTLDIKFGELLNNNKRVSKIETELNEPYVEKVSPYHIFYGISTKFNQPTISGKVDAIIEHLGIDVNITDAVSSKPVAVKKKPVKKTTKKGKK